MGCLLFDDHNFCRQVVTLLEGHCNRSIAEIGRHRCFPYFVEIQRDPTSDAIIQYSAYID